MFSVGITPISSISCFKCVRYDIVLVFIYRSVFAGCGWRWLRFCDNGECPLMYILSHSTPHLTTFLSAYICLWYLWSISRQALHFVLLWQYFAAFSLCIWLRATGLYITKPQHSNLLRNSVRLHLYSKDLWIIKLLRMSCSRLSLCLITRCFNIRGKLILSAWKT